jgi:hypothetical protein
MATHARPRLSHSLLAAAALCLIVVSCAAPGSEDPFADQPGQPSAPGGGNGDGGIGGNGEGVATEGPITIATDGQSFGYEVGRCEVIDGVVYAQARGGDRTGFATIEATLPEWDREIAHSRRTGSVYAVIPRSSPGIGLELTASRNDPGTFWEWTVSGSQVEVTATMGDRTTASRDSGVETFVDYHDVTITIDCSGTFGVAAPGEPMHAEFRPEEAPTDRVPGSVTVDLEGTTYEFPYLVHCQLFSNDVSAEATSDEAYAYFYSEGAGVNLAFEIGDQREEEALDRWMLPSEASLQSDFPFEGSGSTRTWTGVVVSATGGMAEMMITVECSDGDAFDPAGAVSLVVDGVAHEVDEVVSCTIDGTAIEFFGRQSAGSIALVVTSGGTQILFGDDSGQTVTNGVEFAVNGQQATWSGTLAGDRQASVTIDCG